MQGEFTAVARTFSCWGGEFPADLKFYWLHFEVLTDNVRSLPPALLNVPQHTRVSDPQYIISLFRQFLREQENIHRSGAGAPVIADTAADCRGGKRKPDDSPGAALARKAQQIIHTRYHLPVSASTLAKELHCNADYLGRVYRHVFA